MGVAFAGRSRESRDTDPRETFVADLTRGKREARREELGGYIGGEGGRQCDGFGLRRRMPSLGRGVDGLRDGGVGAAAADRVTRLANFVANLSSVQRRASGGVRQRVRGGREGKERRIEIERGRLDAECANSGWPRSHSCEKIE